MVLAAKQSIRLAWYILPKRLDIGEKQNAIHKWFVDNVQDGVDDCREAYVTKEQLGELLPTQSGFFFGGTEYDEWYFNDIEHTIEICENALKDSETDSWSDFYYSSSW